MQLSVLQDQTGQASVKRHNPHKYLLYKPTYSQLQTYISAAFKELPPQTTMLLYFSCQPSYPVSKKDPDEVKQ